MNKKFATTLVAAWAGLLCAGAQADKGKRLLTRGVSSIDRAAGGGLTPGAVIGTNATDGETGFSAFATTAGFEMRLEGKTVGKPAKPSEVTMDRPGVLGATLRGCFIHGSMRGYVYASDSPWASKTSAEGFSTFEDLPDGRAQIKVWQSDQLIDVPLQTATIGATLAKNIIRLTVTPRRRRSSNPPAIEYSKKAVSHIERASSPI